jgi:signal transduction histidine kinase
MYLDLLERGKPEKRQHYLAVLSEQSNRLAGLVETILDLSRLELGGGRVAFAPVNLNEVADKVVVAHQPRADAAGLSLLFKPHPELPPVRGEFNQLAQVATNLVANAINYTPVGEVQVYTCLDPAPGEVCLQVQDTGIGIHPDDLPHLFERFYRGRRTGPSEVPGSGLGLGIVKEIVDLHAGRIEVESELGAGSIFRVWLPQATA